LFPPIKLRRARRPESEFFRGISKKLQRDGVTASQDFA